MFPLHKQLIDAGLNEDHGTVATYADGEFVFHPDVSGVPESGLIELAGSEVKIYRLQ